MNVWEFVLIMSQEIDLWELVWTLRSMGTCMDTIT